MNGKSLTKGTPWKLVLAFALPIMAGNLLQQLYNTADTIIVGNFESEAALSAVGTCNGLTMLFLSLAQGFSIGAGVIAAQLFGARKTEELRKRAGTSIILLTAMGIIVSIIGVISCRFILKYILSVPDSLLDMAATYFSIYALGLAFQFGYNIIAALLRSVGDSKAALYFLLISSIVNVALDMLFVAVFHWGVAGAAIATVISQLASCAASFLYIYKKYPLFRFKRKEISFDKKIAGEVLRTGAPMAIQQAIISCGFFFLQRHVNSYGEYMTASFTVAIRIESYMLLPTGALQNTMVTYCGQNIGAGKIDRITKGIKHTLILALTITFILSFFLFTFSKQIIGLFGINGQSLIYCTQHIRSMSFGYLVFAAYFPCLGLFQGVGRGFFATLLSTIALGVRVLFAYTLCYIPFIGYASIWWCQPLGWLIAAIVNYIYFFKGKWKHKDIFNKLPAGSLDESL